MRDVQITWYRGWSVRDMSASYIKAYDKTWIIATALTCTPGILNMKYEIVVLVGNFSYNPETS